MNINTTPTFKITNMLLTVDDSFVPRINNKESKHTMIIAGMLIYTPSQGPFKNSGGTERPNVIKSSLKYCDQLTATVALANAYSKTKAQPIIQAINSPLVA